MTFRGGQSGGYFLKLWPYKVFVEWSSAFCAAGAFCLGCGRGGLSLSVGVVLRLEVQGLIDSTALARYDFSVFFSAFLSVLLVFGGTAFSLPGGMLPERPKGRPTTVRYNNFGDKRGTVRNDGSGGMEGRRQLRNTRTTVVFANMIEIKK